MPNEIYSFGTAGTVADGDVMELAEYAADDDRENGNQAGIARRALVNTVLRQTAHMSAGLAQFIAERYGPGVVDDGDLDKIEAGLEAIIQEMIETALPSSTRIETDFLAASAFSVGPESLATVTQVATATNGLVYPVMHMPVEADTDMHITYTMPEAWDRGTVKAKVLWLPEDGESVGNELTMTLAAGAVSPGESLDVAPGAAVTLSDAVLGDGLLHVSDASAALTVGGDPALGDVLHIVLTRDVDGGGTDMTGAALVVGLLIQYTCNQAVAAW